MLAASALPAAALDLQWSGFGTLGYAQSDRPYVWQRSITDEGSFERDSVLGAQFDLKLNAEWSATVQALLAQDHKKDHVWTPKVAWAFVAWRPDNDWLLRAGKFRVPLLLFSETQDVGTAHDMVRLPNDSYALSPTADFTGFYGTRTWQMGPRELAADLYSGYANTSYRFWLQDGMPPAQPPGAFYSDVRARSTGLVLTLRDPGLTARLGVHHVAVRTADGSRLPVDYPRVELGNGLGYWQVSDLLPGPGVPTTDRLRVNVFTGGVDWNIDAHWRLIAELAGFDQKDTTFGIGAKTGYLNLSRRFGKLTPYVTVGRTLTSSSQREWSRRLRGSDLPAIVPGAALINAAQHGAADSVISYDHRTVGLGASYALAPSVKLKAEWMRTTIGEVTGSASLAPGMAYPSHSRIDVLSLNLSFDF